MVEQWFSRKSDGPASIKSTINASNLPEAQLQNAARVDKLSHKILASNPDLKLLPMFLTIGSKEQSIYHSGPDQLVVTEGLVLRCQTDGELAALLCAELAAMDAEKRRSAPVAEKRRREPPPSVGMNGNAGAGDLTRMAELADYEKRNPRREPDERRPVAENAEEAARDYMVKAGFTQEEFAQAQPLVKFAQSNAERSRNKTDK